MKKQDPMKLKFLADLNISERTVAYLQEKGIDIIRVSHNITEDQAIAELALRENRILITFDKDFGEIYYFYYRKALSVIVLSLKDHRSESVNNILERFILSSEITLVQQALLILYETRYRVVR